MITFEYKWLDYRVARAMRHCIKVYEDGILIGSFNGYSRESAQRKADAFLEGRWNETQS